MRNNNRISYIVYRISQMRRSFYLQRGQSLIEVIIAVTVGVLVLTALTFATIFSIRNASFSKNSAQATKLAQEGIEKVRTGRDRNSSITITSSAVTSWNGSSSSSCSGVVPSVKSDSFWCYQITGSGRCDNPPPVGNGAKCYFTVNSTTGALTYINSLTSFPTSFYEGIPSAANPVFKRVVFISDEASTYSIQKTVTAVVTWTDFAGPHESKLTTILRNL